MLHPSAQKMQDYFQKHFLDICIIEHSTPARSAEDAAKTVGCNIGQIVKSLIFMSSSEKPVLCLVNGPNQLDTQKVKHLLGEDISRATPEFVKETTGFTIGGIPPLGHKAEIEHIFFDADLLCHEKVWAAAGHSNAVFEIAPQKLQELTNGILLS